MDSFRDFVTSHKYLMHFLHHLSSPIGHDDDSNVSENLQEVTVYDTKDTPLGKRAEKLQRARRMIDQGQQELGHLGYKHVFAGFKKANHDFSVDDDRTLAAKSSAAVKKFEEFSKSRGYATTGSFLTETGKTKKSTGQDVFVKGISLAPHTAAGLSKFDVCPRSSQQCRANCLSTEAGNNRTFADHTLSAKILRTHFMLAHPHEFMHMLNGEITMHKNESMWRQNMVPAVRLNITSDIPFEKHVPALFHRHHDVQFYDYTKLHQRVMDQNKPEHPKNYHLTLSHTGTGHDESNDKHVIAALNAGHVVAMVHKRGSTQPTPHHVEDVQTGKRWKVVSGDENDNTFDRHDFHGIPKNEGLVNSLTLKGVKNSDALHFANQVDDDGVIRINKKTIKESSLQKKEASTGKFIKNPWDLENDEKIKAGVKDGLSRKEIAKKHFPNLTLGYVYSKISSLVKQGKIPNRKNNPPTLENQNFKKYWTPEKQYILKRAWNAGVHRETIHERHFSDIPFESFNHMIKRGTANKFGLKNRPHKFKYKAEEDYVSPIDDEAKGYIKKDLEAHKATGKPFTLDLYKKIGKKHYASWYSVRRTKTEHFGMMGHKSLKDIPDEHKDAVREIMKKQYRTKPTKTHPNGVPIKSPGHGTIAKELNRMFPGANYTERHIKHAMRKGVFDKKPIKEINEMNDNQAPLTVDDHRAMVEFHAHKAQHHKDLYDRYEKLPYETKFKQVHYSLWQHHEDKLAEAKFQLRKQEILKGNK